jgi:hypothetical protein
MNARNLTNIVNLPLLSDAGTRLISIANPTREQREQRPGPAPDRKTYLLMQDQETLSGIDRCSSWVEPKVAHMHLANSGEETALVG